MPSRYLLSPLGLPSPSWHMPREGTRALSCQITFLPPSFASPFSPPSSFPLFIHPYAHIPSHPLIFQLSIHLSIHPSVHLCVCLSTFSLLLYFILLMRLGVDIGIWGSPGLPGQSVTFDLQLLPRRHEEQDFQFPEHWSSSVSYHPVLPCRLGSSQASQRPPVPSNLALQAELGQVKPVLLTVATSLI